MSYIKLYQSDIIIADDQSLLLNLCTETKPEAFLNENEYSRYVMSCLNSVSRGGYIFYRLPINLKVYHGEGYYTKERSIPIGQLFFNLNAIDASNDGHIHEFTFKKSVELLALDRVSNIQILMANAISVNKYEVADAIAHNFALSYDDGKIKIIRNNDRYNDYLILEYLCSLGFFGFAYQPLNGQAATLYLCNSDTYLNHGQYSIYNDLFLINIDQLK